MFLPDFCKSTSLSFNNVFCKHSNECKTCSQVKPILLSDSIQKLKLHYLVKNSGKFNFLGCRVPVNTKFDTEFMRRMLHGYSDLQVLDLLNYGFPIGYIRDNNLHKDNDSSSLKSTYCKNHKGAREFPEAIHKYLIKEASHGAIMGPFKQNPFKDNIRLSPLNSVPKSDSTDRRIILDLSCPKTGDSVNSHVLKDFYLGEKVELFFPKIDGFVTFIQNKGQGSLMFKLDLRRAYRQISICPSDYNLVAFKWHNHIFSDTVLPMGLRSSAHICQRVTNAFSFMFLNIGLAILNYLDDFGGVERKDHAFFAFQTIRYIFKRSGLEEALDKCCEPSKKMIFLGILFDTDTMTMSVPPEKLSEVLLLIRSWEHKHVASLQEIQKLLGKLNFVGACVKSSRVFINRILNWLRECYKLDPSVKLFEIPAEVRKDLYWWNKFLPVFNGFSLIDHGSWCDPDIIFSSDSCLSGCGGVMGCRYFHSQFPPFITEQNLHISALELLSVMVCLHIWAPLLCGNKVQIYCDNQAACIAINSGKTRSPFLQQCLREICFISSVHDFHFRARYLEGVQNRTADSLSRWHLHDKFRHYFFFCL